MLTDFQIKIYNFYLAASRMHLNKPYSIRKSFDGFEVDEPEKYTALLKLEKLFKEYPNINPVLFFKAGFECNKDIDYLNLNFFTTYKAIKLYSSYIKKINDELPDSSLQLEFIKDSLIYIKDFCISNNISLLQYTNHRTGEIYTWLNHLLGNKISFFIIFGLELLNQQLYDYLHNMSLDEFEMFSHDYVIKYKTSKEKLKNSKIANKLIVEGIKKIKKIIEESLKQA